MNASPSKNSACACGCGEVVSLGRRYRRGHNLRGTRTGSWIEQGHRFLWTADGRVAEHRVVVESQLGRKLRSDEIVHHVDGDPLNNSADNLVVLTRPEHARLHFTGRKQERWTVEERERAAALYERGLNIDEVAAALGRPYTSTQQTLARMGRTRTPLETRNLRREAA